MISKSINRLYLINFLDKREELRFMLILMKRLNFEVHEIVVIITRKERT
jgi:hypothetical protein